MFKGKLKSPSLGALVVENKGYTFTRYYPIFLEAGKIKVKLYEGGRQIEARGSENNDIITTVEAPSKEFWYKVSMMYDTLNLASMKLSDFRKAENPITLATKPIHPGLQLISAANR